MALSKAKAGTIQSALKIRHQGPQRLKSSNTMAMSVDFETSAMSTTTTTNKRCMFLTSRNIWIWKSVGITQIYIIIININITNFRTNKKFDLVTKNEYEYNGNTSNMAIKMSQCGRSWNVLGKIPMSTDQALARFEWKPNRNILY